MTSHQPTQDTVVFKICHATAWAAAQASGVYVGSTDDARDGFIHFSTAAQVEGTLQKHFTGQDDLVLLAVPAAALAGVLRFEPARDGALFPHLYAPLPTAAVLWHAPIPLSADGRHVIPVLALPDVEA